MFLLPQDHYYLLIIILKPFFDFTNVIKLSFLNYYQANNDYELN